MSKLLFSCPANNWRKNYFGEKQTFLSIFRSFEQKKDRSLVNSFQHSCHVCVSRVQQTLWGKTILLKSLQICSSLWALSRRTFYPQVKTWSQGRQKCIFGVLRNDWVIKFLPGTSRFSDHFRNFRRKTQISDFFRRSCENCIFLDQETFWREITCLKNSLAHFFSESEQRKTLILAE